MTGLAWPWLAVALLVLTVACLAVWTRRRNARAGLLIAHSSRLRALPRFRRLSRLQLIIAAVRTTGALLLILGAVLIAARPVRVLVTQPDRSARDVELCLDVSGSMDRWNLQVVDAVSQIVDQLKGERIGLTIFSGAAVTTLPLTDDYEFVQSQLDQAKRSFEGKDYTWSAGTETVERRASQIGDGLVSCVQRFAPPFATRSRAVVLVSDNDPLGKPDFTLQEAAQYAVRRGVVAYGIGTPVLAQDAQRLDDFRSAMQLTGGSLSLLDQGTNVDQVVSGIQRLDRARLQPSPRGTQIDDPRRSIWLAFAGLLVLLIGTLVRGRS